MTKKNAKLHLVPQLESKPEAEIVTPLQAESIVQPQAEPTVQPEAKVAKPRRAKGVKPVEQPAEIVLDGKLEVATGQLKADLLQAEVEKTAKVAKPKVEKDHSAPIQAKSGNMYKPYNEWKPRHRLTVQEVLSIVELSKTEKNRSEVARQHDVHPAMVKAILEGKLWSKLTGIKPAAKK